MLLKADRLLLGRRGRELLECGPRLEKGRADLELSVLAHTDLIKAAEFEEKHCPSDQGDQWTSAKLLTLLIVFIARFGRVNWKKVVLFLTVESISL